MIEPTFYAFYTDAGLALLSMFVEPRPLVSYILEEMTLMGYGYRQITREEYHQLNSQLPPETRQLHIHIDKEIT